MHTALLALLVLSSTPPTVKAPNEGPARVYLGSLDEVSGSSLQTAADFGLDVAKAPDGSLFIASPGPWTRPLGNVTFSKTLIVRLRALNANEVEVSVEEEGRGKDGVTERVTAFHDRLANALAENRAKKPLAPKHPLEAVAEPVVVKPSDVSSTPPLEDSTSLRRWEVGQTTNKGVMTSVWRLNGRVPLHFTPASERRFLVTEGSVRMLVGNRSVVLSAGDLVVVPKAVRTQLDLDSNKRASLFVVESPPVDEKKTVWLEPKEPKAAVAP